MTTGNNQQSALAAVPPPVTDAKPVVVAGTSLINFMAARHNLEPTKFLSTLIKTVFPSDKQTPSNEQVAAFLAVAKQYDLNPFIKEIYAFPGKGGGIIPIVSIDGWCTLINRQTALDGIDFEDQFDSGGALLAITTIIHRKDRSHPTRITEYMKECARNTEPWQKWPVRMLRHKSLIQCARVAFGLAGIYDPDEAERIAESENGEAPKSTSDGRTKSERLAEKLQQQQSASVETTAVVTESEPDVTSMVEESGTEETSSKATGTQNDDPAPSLPLESVHLSVNPNIGKSAEDMLDAGQLKTIMKRASEKGVDYEAVCREVCKCEADDLSKIGARTLTEHLNTLPDKQKKK